MKMNITRSTKMTHAEKAMRKMARLQRDLAWAEMRVTSWEDELAAHLPGAIIPLESAKADVARIDFQIAKLSELM